MGSHQLFFTAIILEGEHLPDSRLLALNNHRFFPAHAFLNRFPVHGAPGT
jgi:hypothetical protein